jgi:hypothetical protein
VVQIHLAGLPACWLRRLAGSATKRCVLLRVLLSFDSDIGAHLVLVDLAVARQSQQTVWSMHAKPGDAPANPHIAVSAGLRNPRAFNESTSAMVLFKELQVAQTCWFAGCIAGVDLISLCLRCQGRHQGPVLRGAVSLTVFTPSALDLNIVGR